ncbi:hypothetical protein H0H87_012157 [Tephrocybe sp. NHM501043]|nr:hypothetical protein H0H87_012157 [Tephrocybe sp. NHM501043]
MLDICKVVEYSALLQGTNWAAVCTYFISLYGISDWSSQPMANQLCEWTKQNASSSSMTSQRVQKCICHCINHKHIKSNNAPPRGQVLTYLKDLFDDMDINRDIHRLQIDNNISDSGSESEDKSKEEEPKVALMPKKKKKVAFAEKEKPSEKLIPTTLPTPVDNHIDQISKQPKELVLSYAEANWACGMPPQNNFLNVVVNLQYCGMCGQIMAHQIGYHYCHETGQLINKNLIKYDKGR